MQTKKSIFPIRVPQINNIFLWLLMSIIFSWLWVGFCFDVLDLLGIAQVPTGNRSITPNLGAVILFGMFSYLAYVWRYTVPSYFKQYKVDSAGHATLSTTGHLFAWLVTAIFFVSSVYSLIPSV